MVLLGAKTETFSYSLDRQHLEFKLAVAWDSLESNIAAPSPPCFRSCLFLLLFVDVLSFKPSLY